MNIIIRELQLALSTFANCASSSTFGIEGVEAAAGEAAAMHLHKRYG